MDPHYTNIAILTSFVLTRAGEVLGDNAILDDGKAHWQAFSSTVDSEGISEYNSTGYTMVDLYGLGFINDYVQDAAVKADAARIRRLFWWSVTQHYHSPTAQIAGPYSRSTDSNDRMFYQPVLMELTLYRDSLGRIPMTYPGYEAYNDQDTHIQAVLPALVQQSWPTDWIDQALADVMTPRQVRERTEVFTGADAGAFRQMTDYMSPRLAFGSINRDSHNQGGSPGRPIIAHAGNTSSGVGSFRLTFNPGQRVDRTDLATVQQGTSALVVVAVDSYLVNKSHQLSINMEWYGDGNHPLQFLDPTPPAFGSQFRVQWMDYPVWVRLADNTMPQGITNITADPGSSTQPLEVVISATLPITPSQSGWNTVVRPQTWTIFRVRSSDRLWGLVRLNNPS